MTSRTPIKGSCHCGNIRFDLLWPGPASEIQVRQCSCTFCQKRVGSWTSHPDAVLVAAVGDGADLSKYRFGTKTADFYVCSVCGVVPVVVSEIDGNNYAVVNVNAFDDVDVVALARDTTDFDGEGTNDRLARRKRKWISRVEITIASA